MWKVRLTVIALTVVAALFPVHVAHADTAAGATSATTLGSTGTTLGSAGTTLGTAGALLTTPPRPLFLHANIHVRSDMLSSVYDPVEARLLGFTRRYGALVPMMHAMERGAANGVLPRDVSRDDAAEAAIQSALDTSISRLSKAESWDEVGDAFVADARFDADLQTLLQVASELPADQRQLQLTLYYDREWLRQRVRQTIGRIMAKDLMPGRPLINKWWHMARTGNCPRGPLRGRICQRLHNRIWGTVNMQINQTMARVEAQMERAINARLAKLGADRERKFTTIKLTGAEQVGAQRSPSSFDFFHWDHDAKKWDKIMSTTLGPAPSEIVRETVEKYLAKFADKYRPAPCAPTASPPQ